MDVFDRKAADDAIKRGITHLLSINANGRWKGFPTLAGESDIWVTGFVLAHIYKLSQQANVVKKSQDFLLQSRHSSGGWSYSARVPPDADSTAWCLIALQLSGAIRQPMLEEARTFIWSHFTGGGVSTYTGESGIREFISAPAGYPIHGWTGPHPDVSIAAVLADPQNEKVPEIINWLSGQQTKEGFINSYWWLSPYYTSTLLLRALSGIEKHLPEERAKMMAASMVRNQSADGGFTVRASTGVDAFTTALALESFTYLSCLGYQQERNLCASALLNCQQPDGNWAGDFILRIPTPDVLNPFDITSWNSAGGGGNSLIEDKAGLFATAMACHALDCWRQTESGTIN
jgi:Prenyltransferase and squalene oxidase repeat